MRDDLDRIEGDLLIIKQAIGIDRRSPADSPVPHLLLAASGILSILLAWILELLGSARFPAVAAILIGLPPLLGIILWNRIKVREPEYPKPGMAQATSRREFWWQMAAAASLTGTMMACGFSLISGPVLLSLVVLLAFGLLNRPIVNGTEFTSVGWFVSLGVLATWMVLRLPVPLPHGSIVGLTLLLGGSLAALIGFGRLQWSKQ